MRTTTPLALTGIALLTLTACGASNDETAEADTSAADQDRIEELEAALADIQAEQEEQEESTEEPAGPEEAEPVAEEEPESVPEEEPEDDIDTGEEGSSADNDLGTRDAPLSIGETASNGTWEVVVNSVTRDQGDTIAQENQFNDPAPEGTEYALINVSYTYLGDGSTELWDNTGLAYVTETGETLRASDYFVVTPGELDTWAELYGGGTASGNLAIAIPDGDEGTVRAEIGITEDWMDGTDEVWFASVED